MKFLFLIIISSTILRAQPEVPSLKQWATDYTNTLNRAELESLNYRLKTFEDSTSNQLVFLMIPTLDAYPIEYFSHEVAEKNKIGTKEYDNGALLFVAKNDRKLRIEVGYGLEGALPDALANSIIRNVIVPYFKRDDFYAGITAGVDAIISAIAGEYKADRDVSDNGKSSFVSTLMMIIFAIVIFLFRGRRGRRGGIFFGGLGGGGGGFSSGGFGGGFSGGGGSFGGGGSSGGW